METDGLLVRSEGSSLRAVFPPTSPGGRLMTLVTPELERHCAMAKQQPKGAVRRECMLTLMESGRVLAELDAAFGAGLQENKILAELFLDKLARQGGVASAYLEGDMLQSRIPPEYCRGLRIIGRIRVLQAEPGGPVQEIQIETG